MGVVHDIPLFFCRNVYTYGNIVASFHGSLEGLQYVVTCHIFQGVALILGPSIPPYNWMCSVLDIMLEIGSQSRKAGRKSLVVE